jgi:hypothetical protein
MSKKIYLLFGSTGWIGGMCEFKLSLSPLCTFSSEQYHFITSIAICPACNPPSLDAAF